MKGANMWFMEGDVDEFKKQIKKEVRWMFLCYKIELREEETK